MGTCRKISGLLDHFCWSWTDDSCWAWLMISWYFLYLFYDIVGLHWTYASPLTCEKFSGSCQKSRKSGIPPKRFPDQTKMRGRIQFWGSLLAAVRHLFGLCNLGCFCKVSILGEWNLWIHSDQCHIASVRMGCVLDMLANQWWTFLTSAVERVYLVYTCIACTCYITTVWWMIDEPQDAQHVLAIHSGAHGWLSWIHHYWTSLLRQSLGVHATVDTFKKKIRTNCTVLSSKFELQREHLLWLDESHN